MIHANKVKGTKIQYHPLTCDAFLMATHVANAHRVAHPMWAETDLFL